MFSQIRFPHEFKRVKGERGSGADDYYTNGKVSFATDNPFVVYESVDNRDSIKNFLSVTYGMSFNITRDSLYWATGLVDGFYQYIVVLPSRDLIILS